MIRLKSTNESAKIESHGSHALSKEREKTMVLFLVNCRSPFSQPAGSPFGSIDFSLVPPCSACCVLCEDSEL